MNLEHLKVFCIAANKKNFSETAKILHLSQPAVSTQIHQLEEALNVKLFDRTTKKVTLTSSGSLLLQNAEKILALVESTKKQLALLSESIHGDLIIGASLTIGEHVLPYILGKYRQEYPNVNIKMKIYNSEQIIEKLENGEINLGFIESMIDYPKFTRRPFLEDELVIIASNLHLNPIIGQRKIITADELFTLPIILRERGSGTRQVIEEKLKKNQLDTNNLNIILELENTESIKSAVESGMGISIISKAAIHKELQLETLRELSIQEINMKRYFYSVYDEKTLSLPSESFLSFIHKYYDVNNKFLYKNDREWFYII